MSRNMDTMSTSTSESEWQTVNSRRSTEKKVGGYVPPHLRVKITAPKNSVGLNMDDDTFPSLGAKTPSTVPITPRTPMTPATPWKKASFAQKINELITLEQRTETEREAAAAAERDMEGWISLSLKFTRERYIEFNAKMESAVNRIINMPEQLSPMKYSTNYDELEDDVTVYSDDE